MLYNLERFFDHPQVHSFSNRSNEQSLRLTSLDHLGVIAARLRKDATTSSEQDHEELIEILSQVLQTKLDHRSPSPTAKMVHVYYTIVYNIMDSGLSINGQSQ